jgi:hypothetical protein
VQVDGILKVAKFKGTAFLHVKKAGTGGCGNSAQAAAVELPGLVGLEPPVDIGDRHGVEHDMDIALASDSEDVV